MLWIIRWVLRLSAELIALAIILGALKWLWAKLAKVAYKLIDNAVIGWADEVIGRVFGITSPDERLVFSLVVEWGPPLLLLMIGLWFYHSLYRRAWVRGEWRPRPRRWGLVAIYTRLADRLKRPPLISITHGTAIPKMVARADAYRRKRAEEQEERELVAMRGQSIKDHQAAKPYSPPPSGTEEKRQR